MDSFRRQKIDKLILMNLNLLMVKYWILEVLIKQKNLKIFLTNKTNIKILNKNKNYQADFS